MATTFTMGTKTYTATKSQTITITDCPCTYVTSTYASKPSSTPVEPSYAEPTPVVPSSAKPTPVEPSYTEPAPIYITTTETVKTLTTYCSSSTELVQGNKTYTVTEATTLTITDCPW